MMKSSYYIYLGIQSLFFTFVHISSSQQLCPPPDVPRYGDYSQKRNNFQPGDKVTYNCTDMYILMGKETSKCKTNGDWSNPTPFCDLKAQVESPFKNNRQGHSLPSLQIIDGDTSTCTSFISEESIRMTLKKPGSVYAVRLFLKRGNINIEIVTGSITCTLCKKYLDADQWVLLQCNRNTPVSNSIRLQSKAGQTMNNTICEIEVYSKEDDGCDNPPDRRVANGYFEVTRNLAILICENGYQNGNGRLVCEKNAWVGSRLECNEILCSPVINVPAAPGSEWVFLDSVKKISAGTRRQLKCSDGYTKAGGPETVICQRDGVWTSTNATCVENSKGNTRLIIIGAVSGFAVLIIIALFATTIYFVKKQRREVVVVYKTTADGSMSGSEPEYASIYYESIKSTIPQPPPSTRPTVQMISEGYFSPLDSHDSMKKQPTPVDIAFGTLKQSTLYR